MKVTQGTFSFLPDLTDAQIAAQVQYCLDNGWAVNIEFTDDPHPRNTYWDMWGQPDERAVESVQHLRDAGFDEVASQIHGLRRFRLPFHGGGRHA